MDDLEFRRRLLSNPKEQSDEIINKIQSDNSNKKYAESIKQLDQQIEQAMNVDVPDDLADKIIFNTSNEKPKIQITKQAFALAASVIFAVGLMVGQINWGAIVVTPAHANLSDMAVEHIQAEQHFIKGVNEANNDQEMSAKLAAYSYQLTSEFPYKLYYLNHCGFTPDHHALHMVFQGKQGRVTAFISNVVTTKTSGFDKEGMKGAIVPLAEGSLVVVGNESENVSLIASQLAPLLKVKS